ncbi:MAG: efflux RND transporter periplasmic adaptor subunit [Acidobacteriia bacterium]|nr:efflux RND transporter periplasmic adaptor subunit [Terriglobia bacterium]
MRKVLILLIVGLPTLVVVAAILWTAGAFTRAEPVDVVEVQLAALHRSITTNGKIEADRVTELRAPLSGICRRTDVHEGAPLKKGQEIVRIEDPSLPSQQAVAQAELDAAQLDLHDVQRGPAPEELNQAEAEATRAQLARDNARKILQTNEWLLEREAISRYEVEQSRHALAEAEQALRAAQMRQEDLRKRYGDPDRRRAQSRVEAAQARLQYLNLSRERLVVRAPEDGTLFQLNIKDGAYLNTGDAIGLLADLTHLRLRAYVDEPDIGQVAVGEKVLVRWDAHPLEQWQGLVMRLPAQVVALGTRSVAEVLCSIDNAKGTLIPNINVDVEIEAPNGPAVTSLPRSVVFPEGAKEFVWTIDGGKAVKHYVETGRSTNTRIEITGGLSPGEKVIDPGDMLISDSLKVTAKTR